jgi:hypothetical protein
VLEGVAVQDATEGIEAYLVLAADVVDDAGEPFGCEAGGEVEQGPGATGCGDAALARDVTWLKRLATMGEDARTLTATLDHDVQRERPPRQKPPQARRRRLAQQGARATCQDRRRSHMSVLPARKAQIAGSMRILKLFPSLSATTY